MGRSTINGPFSIAMLVYQRVIIPTDELHHFSEGWLNHQPVPLAATSVWQITARCRARPSRVTLGEDLSPGFLFRWPNQSAAAKQGAAARQSSGIREVGWWSWGTVGKSWKIYDWLLVSNMAFIFHNLWDVIPTPLTNMCQDGENHQPDEIDEIPSSHIMSSPVEMKVFSGIFHGDK